MNINDELAATINKLIQFGMSRWVASKAWRPTRVAVWRNQEASLISGEMPTSMDLSKRNMKPSFLERRKISTKIKVVSAETREKIKR